MTLRWLRVPPTEAGRIVASCLDRSEIDHDLINLLTKRREEIGRQREDLDRLELELLDLDLSLGAGSRARSRLNEAPILDLVPIRALFV